MQFQILQSFEISDVTGEGLLSTFKVAGSNVYWQKGEGNTSLAIPRTKMRQWLADERWAVDINHMSNIK